MVIGNLVFASGATAQSIDGVPIGATTPSTGKFTNLEATTSIKLGSDTVTSFDQVNDSKVKSSATDTTSGFLVDELQGGTNVTVSEVDVGGNKKVSVSVSDKLTTKGDVLIHNGTSETRLPIGSSGQYLTSDTGDNLLWANPPEGDQLFNSNVLLNAYRTAENGSRPVLKMVDGAVDAFEDETGVDATASTNEDYDSSNDLYKPTGGSGFNVPAVNFDGTNDYLTISDANLGQSDGKSFTISLWVNLSHQDGDQNEFIRSTNSNIIFQRTGTSGNDQVRLALRNSAGTTICNVRTTSSLTASGGLTHILVGIDLANQTVQFRLNGGSIETNIVSTAVANDTFDFTDTTLAIGGATTGGASKHEGDMAQLWLAEEYIDISTSANLAKFYNNGNPVNLGSDGSAPTGNTPIIYLNNTTSTWQNNLGSGGDFTENGALTDGTDLSNGSGTPENMTLVSESQTAKTEANGANIVLFAEDVEADITLNTDLKASVSRDGGTTFTQVTLSDAGEFEKGNLLTGTVDISSQPSGTDMQWKVETDNNKALNLHGMGLEWR